MLEWCCMQWGVLLGFQGFARYDVSSRGGCFGLPEIFTGELFSDFGWVTVGILFWSGLVL